MVGLLKKLCLTVALAAPVIASAGVVFEPSLHIFIEERYDDDVTALLDTEGVPGARGMMMSKISPQLGFELRDPTLTVNSWYSLDFTHRHGSHSTFDHRGQLNVDKRLTERLSLDSELRVWRVSDPTSLPRMGMVRSFSPVLYGRAELGARYRATRRFTLRPGYRFEGARIEEEGLGVGLSHMPFVEGWYRLTRRAELGVDYRLQYFLFQEETAHAHGAALALRYRLFRRVGLTARAGPTAFQRAGGSGYALTPRVMLDLHRDGEFFDLTLAAGHDLVGASGFDSAVWADYASVMGEWRFWRPIRIYAGGSLYRNGPAPAEGWFERLQGEGVSTGYSLGAGVEWEALQNLSLIFAVNRHSQLGFLDRRDLGVAGLDLNSVSLRVNFRAF